MAKQAFYQRIYNIMITCATVILSLYAVNHYHNAIYNHKTSDAHIAILPKGLSSIKTANLLYKKGIIPDKITFLIAAKFKHYIENRQIIAGEYHIDQGMNVMQILDKLSSGDVVVHKLTIPEGLLTSDVMQIIINANQLINDLDPSKDINIQGIIAPDTYFYTYGAKATELLRQMTESLNILLESNWQNRDKEIDQFISTKEQALVLASIIEKESSRDAEKPDIAAVYINRLKENMRLQADPTVIFAITEGKTFDLKLSYNDLKFNSPYNTYMVTGLPPSPICNPSKTSIYAALHPSKNNYLYFVAAGKGGHVFAQNFKEHSCC